MEQETGFEPVANNEINSNNSDSYLKVINHEAAHTYAVGAENHSFSTDKQSDFSLVKSSWNQIPDTVQKQILDLVKSSLENHTEGNND